MRIVLWTDAKGVRHKSAVRDGDGDDAARYGLPLDPPDLSRVDWEGVKVDIHNALLDLGVASWRDWQKHQDKVQGAILRPLVRRLVALFREAESEGIAREVKEDGE